MITVLISFSCALIITNCITYKLTTNRAKRENKKKLIVQSIEFSQMLMHNTEENNKCIKSITDTAVKAVQQESDRADKWQREYAMCAIACGAAYNGAVPTTKAVEAVHALQLDYEHAVELLTAISTDPTGLTAEMYGINLDEEENKCT
ncbi:TPA: hypothetical protein ACSP1Y_002988 [Aeromonas hydrophila]|uniref:hypothetical protein n=1 Tax=Aeromonas allosaccharophila TaxID=656 RepID=UPI003986052B